jgi:hypothetical protein
MTIAGFADVAKPLTELTEEERKYRRSQSKMKRCDLLQSCSPWKPARRGEAFIVDTDASDVRTGVCVVAGRELQEQQEPVLGRNGVWSDAESLAVLKSLEHFYKQICGQELDRRTDNSKFT